jgi:hypothetical protein
MSGLPRRDARAARRPAESADGPEQVGGAERGQSRIVQRWRVHPLALAQLRVEHDCDAVLHVIEQCKRRHRPRRQSQHRLKDVGPGEEKRGAPAGIWADARASPTLAPLP